MSFLRLVHLHRDLLERFLRHQDALLDRRLDEAAALLESVRFDLRRHIREEEEWMLPLYRRADSPAGGSPSLFLSEHRKIEEALDRFGRELADLRSNPPNWRRKLLGLLEEQARFKNLLDHHDRREAEFLYPILDRVTNPEERETILRRCLGG